MTHQSSRPLPRALDILKHFTALGVHRTGTEVDRTTTVWLEGMLQEMDARVERHRYGFPMVHAEAALAPPLHGVPLLPLYYTGTGAFETGRVHVAALSFEDDHGPGGIGRDLAAIVADAWSADAELALIATQCANQSLCAINRNPDDALNFPICLAPGHALARLKSSALQVRFAAKVADSTSDNLVATLGDPTDPRPPLVITTPTTGWFVCAGERGSGIALALSVSAAVSEDHPVLLALTSGHELGFLGGRRFVEQFNRPITGVLHVGSCVADKAALDGKNGTFREGAVGAVARLDDTGFQEIAGMLRPLGIATRHPERPRDPACWVGESELWAGRDMPMLSVAGTSTTFHTPEDTFETAADGRLLDRVTVQITSCASLLLKAKR